MQTDPLDLHDPWAHAAELIKGPCCTLPMSSDISVPVRKNDMETQQLAAHIKELEGKLEVLEQKYHDRRRDTLYHADSFDSLVHTQNSTIATLVNRLDQLLGLHLASDGFTVSGGYPAQSGYSFETASLMEKMSVCEAQCKAAHASIERLASSMGTAVQDSVDKRVSELSKNSASRSDLLAVASDTKDLVRDVSQAITAETQTTISTVVTGTCSKALAKAWDEMHAVQNRKFEELRYELLGLFADNKTTGLKGQQHDGVDTDAADPPFTPCDLEAALQPSSCECHPTDSSNLDDALDLLHAAGGSQTYVRLDGLKNMALNGRIGTVMSFDDRKKRYGVLLHGESTPKAVKKDNLLEYFPLDADMCHKCLEHVNLFAFPACGCGPCSSKSNANMIPTEPAKPGSSTD